MVTQKGDNTAVVGIRGNFDDAQNGVKAMFNNAELKERLARAGIASLPPTPSISAGWYRRSFITSMPTASL